MFSIYVNLQKLSYFKLNLLEYINNRQNLCKMSNRKSNVKDKTKNIPSSKSIKNTNNEENTIHLDKSNNILITIIAKPGAKQNAITDISSEGVGVQINAPPSEGEANIELIKYMSSILGLKKNDVTLERGFKSRNKILKVDGNCITIDDLKLKIMKEINN